MNETNVDLNELKRQRDELIGQINLQRPVSKEVKQELHEIGKKIRAAIFRPEVRHEQ